MAHNKILVLYDASCPRCVKDRQFYEKLIGLKNSHIIWCDFNCHRQLLQQFNISALAAMTELHIIVDDQKIIKSIAAYVLLLNQIIYLKPIAWLMNIPIIYRILEFYYHKKVQKRLKDTGRL